jgi:hypothetical protein
VIRGRRRLALALGAAASAACAHVNPTLVPARLLRAGHVVVDTGGAYSAPVAEPVLAAAREADARTSDVTMMVPEADRDSLARAAQAFGATSTGAASYVAARGGLPGRVELQGALMGLRTARLGVRRAFGFGPDDKWALAMGLQARLGLDFVGYRAAVGRAEVRDAQVLGGDFTVQLGRTSSELYDVWVGARAGYTHGAARVWHPAFTGDATLATELHRAELSLNFGLRVGFGRVAALAELDVSGAAFWGSAQGSNARASGFALALVPAGALAFSF